MYSLWGRRSLSASKNKNDANLSARIHLNKPTRQVTNKGVEPPYLHRIAGESERTISTVLFETVERIVDMMIRKSGNKQEETPHPIHTLIVTAM